VTGDPVGEFWRSFVEATGIDGAHSAWGFASGPLMTELGLLVRDGPKRATAGLLADYEQDGEPLPQPGDLSVILDEHGRPLCVIRATAVEVRRFGDVDEEFAWTEGEGDRSLAYWREAHLRFFASAGHQVDDDSLLVLERFELLWPLPLSN
jgi:uncharacterized protein YhfF